MIPSAPSQAQGPGSAQARRFRCDVGPREVHGERRRAVRDPHENIRLHLVELSCEKMWQITYLVLHYIIIIWHMIYLACEKKMLLKYFVRVRSPRLYLALHEQWVGPGLPLFSGRVTSLLARPPVIVHRVRLGPPRFFSRSLNSLLISTFHLILLPDHVFEMRVQFFSHYFSIAILLHHMFTKCMHNYFLLLFNRHLYRACS